MSFSRTARVYYLESKYEFLKLVRLRAYVIYTLMFPLMFYVFFGLLMGRQAPPGQMPLATYLLGTYGTFGVIGVALFGFGVGVAVERGLGWLQVKRASPMPPLAHLVARLVVCAIFSMVLITALFAMGVIFGGVRMPAEQWVLLTLTLLAGTIPFCTLGLAIGNVAKPNSAPALVNVLYMPMAFCSGLWIPLQFLPDVLHQVARVLPAYHLSQIALTVMHAPAEGSVLGHWEALAGFSLLFAGLAWLGYRREQEKMYG
jgi:ABC-2 type transport system permease protein